MIFGCKRSQLVYRLGSSLVFSSLVCVTQVALGGNQELGHPLFRTFTAGDFGSVVQIQTVAQDSQGRMLFVCDNAIAMFDNSRWETIPTPGAGFVRSLAIDGSGAVWFSSIATTRARNRIVARVPERYEALTKKESSICLLTRGLVRMPRRDELVREGLRPLRPKELL
jgi:hypothetical protein